MKIADMITNILVPVVSVATALMVALLNQQVSQNDLELRSRDQQLQERLAELDLLVKKNKEEREERESNQGFNLKIYEIVTKSLEEKNAQKQEAAKAFVVVMVDEPLRSSLLNVLKQGGELDVKEDIGKILAAEEKFQTYSALVPKKTREIAPTYSWGEWDFDVFWCAASGDQARMQAEKIGEQLVSEGAKGRIRIRELPDSINAKSGYQIDGYAIRRNSGEEKTAQALKQLAEKALQRNGDSAEFSVSLTRQNTPWYISVFLCPSS
jgi:hypothetical protein